MIGSVIIRGFGVDFMFSMEVPAMSCEAMDLSIRSSTLSRLKQILTDILPFFCQTIIWPTSKHVLLHICNPQNKKICCHYTKNSEICHVRWI